MEVALAIGRVLQHLTVTIAIALRRFDMRKSVDDEHALRHRIHSYSINRSAWNNDVVARPVGQVAVHGFHSAAAIVHKHDLIAIGVFEEVTHLLRGDDVAPFDVAVSQQNGAARYRVTARLQLTAFHVPMVQRLVLHVLRFDAALVFELRDARRQIDVVGHAHDAAEAVDADELLGVEATFGLVESDVALAGKRSELYVAWHGCPAIMNGATAARTCSWCAACWALVDGEPVRGTREGCRRVLNSVTWFLPCHERGLQIGYPPVVYAGF